MFEPEHKSKWYLILIFFVALIIGWSMFSNYKNLIIQASCSEIAASSSGFIYKEKELLDPDFSYENLKSKCLQDSEFE